MNITSLIEHRTRATSGLLGLAAVGAVSLAAAAPANAAGATVQPPVAVQAHQVAGPWGCAENLHGQGGSRCVEMESDRWKADVEQSATAPCPDTHPYLYMLPASDTPWFKDESDFPIWTALWPARTHANEQSWNHDPLSYAGGDKSDNGTLINGYAAATPPGPFGSDHQQFRFRCSDRMPTGVPE